MAKKKKKAKQASGGGGEAPDRAASARTLAALADSGIKAFEAGHYDQARGEIGRKLARDDLPEGERQLLGALLDAMRVDPTTLYTGLGCIALYLVAILVAVLKQP